MLVDQQNGNILSLLGETVKGVFDGRGLGLVVDHEVVLLRVWGVGDVLCELFRTVREGLIEDIHQLRQGGRLLPSPEGCVS